MTNRAPLKKTFRRIAATLFLLLLTLLLSRVAHLPRWSPTPTNSLAEADHLFASGQYFAAMREYTHLVDDAPTAERLLRLGMILVVRGEYAEAERKLHRALGLGLPAEQHNLALLYLSQSLRERGLGHEAAQTWGRVRSPTPLEGPWLVLRAEWDLRQGHSEVARAAYEAARTKPLPANWVPTIAYRLALLQAAHGDPVAARSSLQIVAEAARQCEEDQICFPSHTFPRVVPTDPFLTPLVPNTGHEAGQLLTLLQTRPPEQYQLLGQFSLDLGLYSLALEQFAHIAPDSSYGPIATAYAGYTRWQSGEGRAGLQQVETLVARYPTNPQIRLLLVLMLVQEQDFGATRRHLDILTRQYPDMPDVYVARAQWAMRQHDYAAAMRGYQKALSLVEQPVERRGEYALLTARFHLATTYELCRHGVSSAELAARMRPDDGQAWTTLAAIRYHCGYSGGAAAAARVALEWGGGGDARYYLGAALLELGHYEESREMLIQVADMAPASVWRQRAEDKLDWLLAEQ